MNHLKKHNGLSRVEVIAIIICSALLIFLFCICINILKQKSRKNIQKYNTIQNNFFTKTI